MESTGSNVTAPAIVWFVDGAKVDSDFEQGRVLAGGQLMVTNSSEVFDTTRLVLLECLYTDQTTVFDVGEGVNSTAGQGLGDYSFSILLGSESRQLCHLCVVGRVFTFDT